MKERAISPLPQVPVLKEEGGKIVNKMREELWQWFQRLSVSLAKQATYEFTLDPITITADNDKEETITLKGLSVKDIPAWNPPDLPIGISIAYMRISDVDTLVVRHRNNSAGTINIPSGKYYLATTRR